MHAVWWLATRPVALLWIGLALLVWRRPQPAVAMAAAALASWGLALATKELVGRSRPTTALLGGAPLAHLGDGVRRDAPAVAASCSLRLRVIRATMTVGRIDASFFIEVSRLLWNI